MVPSSTHNMTTRRRRRTTEAPITQTSTTTTAATPTVSATSTANTKKYRNRDSYETFFRPKTVSGKSKTSSKNMKQKKRKGLTDKQRVKEAHEHWVIDHGVARDAEKFLNLKANTNNVSVETLVTLNLMITNPFERATVNPSSPPVELTWTTVAGAEIEHYRRTPMPKRARLQGEPSCKSQQSAEHSSSTTHAHSVCHMAAHKVSGAHQVQLATIQHTLWACVVLLLCSAGC